MGQELVQDVMLISGLSEAEARTVIAADAPRDAVFPTWLRPAIEIAQMARGQWRILPRPMAPAALLGLDWNAWDRAARWLGHTIDRSVAEDLQIIEDEALRIMSPS